MAGQRLADTRRPKGGTLGSRWCRSEHGTRSRLRGGKSGAEINHFPLFRKGKVFQKSLPAAFPLLQRGQSCRKRGCPSQTNSVQRTCVAPVPVPADHRLPCQPHVASPAEGVGSSHLAAWLFAGGQAPAQEVALVPHSAVYLASRPGCSGCLL